MDAPQLSGNHLLKTVGACIASPLVAIVCAALAGGLWGLMNSFMTVIRPEIIGFFAALVGGYMGMYGSRMFCDHFLSGYVPQVVFFVNLTLLLGMCYFYAFVVPFEWKYISSYAQLVLFMFLNYLLYWMYESV